MTTAQDPSDPVGLLLKEYCPPLDSAIVLAISLDYDSVDDARAVLDSLKAETIVDEADGAATGDADHHSDWLSNVFSDEDTSATATTRTSTGSKSEHSSSSDGDDATIRPLALMFPHTSKYTLKHTLQKCSGDMDRAIDELLNLKFLDGEGEGLKGVDAFSEASMVHAKRNSKSGRKKGKKVSAAGNNTIWEDLEAAAATAGSAAGGTGEPSKWELMQSEISYLSSKLNLPLASVTSAYHRHGSLSATLVALIETFGEGDVVPEDASHLETISAIASKHPRLPQTHIVGLVKLCKDDIPSAFKFAELLNRRQLHKVALQSPPPQTPATRSQGVTSPITPTSPSDGWHAVVSPRKSTSAPASLPMSPTSPPSKKLSYKAATLAANDHAIARSEAYDKASAAYRRSKSDHLMGAVATYYAEEGKSHDTRLKAYNDMAAEALVAENSSEYTLDLHGVTVAQALKITNERVTSWWVRTNSTDDKALTPFHIITGIGSHSKNGESRIGPAVSKMLLKGNWKIEIRTGNIRVLGVQKPVAKKK
ncbi:hypothetical protein TWF696_003982 [Orbilia brochopaga]|uniref:Smr domain-containing protein n=1 Tax=Orbilia brochopaga TaxID=3140254 RepID=A0AAV9V739_9PEZI